MTNNLQKYLIIGDFILDTYIFGSIEKISPEAPVMEFVFNGKIEHKFGGAANVAWILDNLGIEGNLICKTDVDCCCITALKHYGLQFNSIQFNSILYGKTCQKIRLIDENYHQHILRIAVEDGALPSEHFVQMIDKQDLTSFNKVIFCDYQKGLLSDENILYVRKKCQNIPILVAVKYNWKGYNHVDDLPDCDLVVCNHKEIAASFSVSKDDVLKNSVLFAERVVRERGFKNCIITLGANGATFFSASKADRSSLSSTGKGKHIPTVEKEIFDVTGAGDSFFAVCCYLWGNDLEKIIHQANLAAGMNVASLGNTLVEKILLQ